MPLIGTRGAASSRGFGRFGGDGSDAILLAMQTAFGTATSPITVSAGSWTYLDFRGLSGSDKVLTVTAKGSAGGGGNYAFGFGASITATVPTSYLAGKIIAFVCANQPQPIASGRASSGGGGFSGLIQLETTGYAIGSTLTHIISAGGGGGANGGGDQGYNIPGVSSTSIVYGNSSPSPSGGTSLAKNQSGSTGYYPGLSYAGKAGNKYGGGDGANNSAGTDLFVNPGGGGYGPRAGVLSDGQGDPTGLPTGHSMGYGTQTPLSSDTNLIGSIGGGGCGAQGASGSVTWRVISAGGGGGGFQGGSTGYGGTDGSASPAGAGVSYCYDSSKVISFSGNSSNSQGYLQISWS